MANLIKIEPPTFDIGDSDNDGRADVRIGLALVVNLDPRELWDLVQGSVVSALDALAKLKRRG